MSVPTQAHDCDLLAMSLRYQELKGQSVTTQSIVIRVDNCMNVSAAVVVEHVAIQRCINFDAGCVQEDFITISVVVSQK